MAYFAELDDKNVVVRVIVIHDNHAIDGEMFCQTLLGGRWIQTFNDGITRKQYAGIGYTYDSDADVFISPQPYSSWTLDNNKDWQPPTPKPEGNHTWDEETLAWVEVTVG